MLHCGPFIIMLTSSNQTKIIEKHFVILVLLVLTLPTLPNTFSHTATFYDIRKELLTNLCSLKAVGCCRTEYFRRPHKNFNKTLKLTNIHVKLLDRTMTIVFTLHKYNQLLQSGPEVPRMWWCLDHPKQNCRKHKRSYNC